MAYLGYADIRIDNPNSVDLTDFQVCITLDSNNFPNWNFVRDDGIDIYFTLSDGTTEIPFWREEFDKTNKNAKFWVKVPSIPTNSYTMIRMYFGNPDETVDRSDSDSTFEFFDDFSEGVIDTTKWTNNGISISTTDGMPNPPSAYTNTPRTYMYANAIPDITKDYIIEFYTKTSDLNDFFFFCDENGAGQMFRLETRDGNPSGFATTSSWTSWENPSGLSTVTANEWHHITLTITGDTAIGTIDGIGSAKFTITRKGGYIGLQSDGLSAGDYWDLIIIRKYASQEPTFSIQSLTIMEGTITSTLVKSTIQQSVESFTGDGTTTQFTVSNKPIIPKVRVFLNDIERVEGTDYTVDYTNGIITFSTAPNSGDIIKVVYYYGELDYIENAIVKAYFEDYEYNSTTTGQYGQYSLTIPKNVEVKLRAETDGVDSITVVKLTD